MSYQVTDENGEDLGGRGIVCIDEAHTLAQQIANELGESVLVCDNDSAETVEPVMHTDDAVEVKPDPHNFVLVATTKKAGNDLVARTEKQLLITLSLCSEGNASAQRCNMRRRSRMSRMHKAVSDYTDEMTAKGDLESFEREWELALESLENMK